MIKIQKEFAMQAYRFFLVIMLTMYVPASSAAWDFVVERGGTSVYMDKSLTQIKGHYAEAVWVSNFGETQRLKSGRQYLQKNSLVYRSLFDCKNQYFKVLESVWYDARFGQGNGHTNSRAKPQWWTPGQKVYQNNLNLDVMKLACK
ncbi:MAG: hypothetical protein B7Z35_00090 [Hydrogenophilales bacterium 12-61-10]|nr:MAG: hypothetical protein B7Z35_00090 [Hydrogenophilales bacterium 12-61-10]